MVDSISSLGGYAWNLVGAPASSAARQQREAQMFKEMDTDGNGSVSQSEFTNWLDQTQSQMPATGSVGSMPSADDIFAQLDTNGDGVLTPDELSNMHAKMRAMREAQLFKEMDTDGDGSVSKDEFANWLQKMQSQMSATGNAGSLPSADVIFAQLDTNGDGVLSADELSNMHEKMRAIRDAKLFNDMDTNGDGAISKEEFANWLLQAQSQMSATNSAGTLSSADDIFTQLDQDAGALLTGLLNAQTQSTGSSGSQSAGAADANGDGQVSSQELLAYYAQIGVALDQYLKSEQSNGIDTVA